MGGTLYLLSHSFILISIVALIGLAIGWWWRSLSSSKTHKELLNLEEFQQRLQQKLGETERHATDLERLNADLRQSRHSLDLQLSSLTQEFDDFKEANTDIDLALARKDSEIADKIAQIDELETRMRAQLQRAGHRGDSAGAENDPELANLQATLRERDLELEQQRAEVRELQQLLEKHDSDAEDVRASSEIETTLAAMSTEIGERDRLLQERDGLLQERDAQLHDRDAQLHERDAQLHERDAQLHERDAQLHERQTLIESLETRLDEAEASRTEGPGEEEVADLRNNLTAYQAAISERDQQLTSLSDELTNLQQRMEAEKSAREGTESAQIRSLQQHVDELNAAIAERDRVNERSAETAARLEARIASLETQTEEQIETEGVMHDELRSFKSALDERDRIVATLEHKLTNIEDSSRTRIEDLEEDLRKAEDLSFSKEAEIAGLRQQVESYDNNSLEILRDRVAERELAVEQLQSQIQELTSEREDTSRMQTAYAKELEELQWSIAQKDNEVSRLRKEASAQETNSINKELELKHQAEMRALSDQLVSARATLDQQKQRLEELEEQVASLRISAPPSASAPPAETGSLGLIDKPVFDNDLGPVYGAEPDHADDLTAIKGIAEVLSGKLNKLGVYTFKQIANWTEEQVEQFSLRLEFKDRIQRDKWIPQSQALHEEKYGENV